MDLTTIRDSLHQHAAKDGFKPIFFKVGSGQYAEHDQFIGVSVPILKKLAKLETGLSLADISVLLSSPINEERQLAIHILIKSYQKKESQEELYQFLLKHLKYINNWNLVDGVAPAIIGAHLLKRDKALLLTLAVSPNLWERRIAIVTTYYFIKQGSFEWTLKIAELLLKDAQDLIHKAVGWMLRELGKRNMALLLQFLDQFSTTMPRTMLRYAIERFPEDLRLSYLKKPSKVARVGDE